MEVQLSAYWMSRSEVSWADWQLCVEDGRCRAAQGRGAGSFPVTGVNWADANAYAEWLSRKSGFTYRVPSEAEWEYAARAGTRTAYWWGADYPGPGVTRGQAQDGGHADRIGRAVVGLVNGTDGMAEGVNGAQPLLKGRRAHERG